MGKVEFTKEQKRVIDARDCNLLVSAAAGSGKTAVLVERIIGRLLDEKSPASLDRLLVMTFTRAAAEGMRQKISEALSERMRNAETAMKSLPEDSPEFRRLYGQWAELKNQETLLPRARIATIDSVCQTMIRQYFQFLEIDPAFRVADEAELKLMMYDILKDLLEDKYNEGAEDFIRFSEAFTKNGLDERLSELILRTFRFASAHPWPEEFLARFDRDAAKEAEGKIWDTDWIRAFMDRARLQAEAEQAELEKAIKECEAPDGWKPYLEILTLLKDVFENLGRCLSGDDCRQMYAEARQILLETELPDLSRKGCGESTAEKKASAKAVVEEARELKKQLSGTYFSISPEMAEESIAGGAADIRVLIRLTLEFMERFAEKKKSRSIVDFNDMEHLALKLLYREENGTRKFTPLADELAQGLDEILIDEYQDSNEVQEELIRALSAERFGRPDVFMVGDVKQSIYSFRQAKPALFMEKYRNYTASGKNVKIELNRNFRSRPEVLDTVNDVFREIMRPSCGGICYDDAAALYPGRPDCVEKETGKPIYRDGAVSEFLLVEENAAEPAGEDTDIRFSSDELEYVMIAKRILELTEGKRSPGPYAKKDITILMRNSGKAEKMVDVLARFKIDAVFDSATGYFGSQEVSTMLALLAVIDNPRQDIPLATVMKSPLGGFSDGELADLRIRFGKKENGTAREFYDVLADAAASEEKPGAFLEKLNAYRRISGVIPVHELIHRIYVKTGYYDYVSALPGGKKRRRNLDMLLQRAENYSATSYHGLFNFNRYIEQLQNYETDYGEAGSTSGNDDVVKITTIHKSKGLEYPVTIIAGMSGRFNLSDTRESLVMDEELGFACDYVDTEKRLRYPSLKAAVIRDRFRTEQAGEELRILYVAMTRAQDKLIMSGKINDYLKKLDEERKSGGDVSKALSEQQFVLRSGALEKESLYPVISESTALEREIPPGQEEREKAGDLRALLTDTPVPEKQLEAMRDRLQAVYGHEEETALKPKVSVSELKARLITEFESEFVRDLEENRATKGAEYGTMVHRAFEVLDYSKEGEDALPDLPGADADTMRSIRRTIAAFRKTELAAEMKEAFLDGKLRREQHFMLGLPASELTPDSHSEELQLMQGIIDAYMITPDGIRLVDYKTDRVETEETLVSRYALQLNLYARALEQLLRVPVTEKLIYSTCLGKTIKL